MLSQQDYQEQAYHHQHLQISQQEQEQHEQHVVGGVAAVDPKATTCPPSSSSIIELNNRGVQYLRLGQVDTAVVALAHALNSVRQRSQEEATSPSSSANNEDQDEHLVSDNLSDWFSDLMMTSTSIGSIGGRWQQLLLTSSSSFIYQTPLELPFDDEMATLINVQCVTIMFNLAMAFHLQGMNVVAASAGGGSNVADIDQGHYLLNNAIQMYELCYEMMSTDESFNPGIYFIMCLTNNLGCVHMALGNTTKSDKCFQHLLCMQMYVTDAASTIDGSTGVGGSGSGSSDHSRHQQDEEQDIQSTATRIELTSDVPSATTESSSSDHNKDSVDTSSESAMDVTFNDVDDDDDDYHQHVISSSPFDGFLHNTSRLILLDNCASAA